MTQYVTVRTPTRRDNQQGHDPRMDGPPRHSSLLADHHHRRKDMRMDDLGQTKPLDPTREPGDVTLAPDISPAQEAQIRVSCDQLTTEKISATRHTFYAAAAEAIVALQNGQRLSGEHLFAAAHAQASRTWWDLVDEEIASKKLTSDHALRRVRSRARHSLTEEPPVARPGTLFDHALAHAARIAARDFLHHSGHLLTQHLIHQANDPAPATPAASGHQTPPSAVAGP
ncbi:hypothetical protein HCN51_39300 [Nonomuraea sp. FMUSA5-5]|uniref:SAV-6107-like HEPN domain-containing protein n=1 Tax=Nonomuraea composti TaxID=2720023 RepID=A0ABX1BJY0_9ACTN|nr:hypothetical protein [Nonomuraea sp. FMUSA5-5]NJP95418.1 hypothetical protein [Nonomuraea sp. FMUSA5-5]